MENLSYPFLTREMLTFDKGATLALTIQTRATGTDAIFIRGMTRQGPFVFSHNPAGDGSLVTESFAITDVPIWVTVDDTNLLQIRKTLYVQISLSINGDILYQLASGFVFGANRLTWPKVERQMSDGNIGALVLATSSDPAAGVELSLPVTTNRIWRVKSVRFTLVTSSGVANRRPHLVFMTGGTAKYFDCFSSIDQVASTTRVYSCIPVGAVTDETDDNDIIIPIPADILLTQENGDKIVTETTNLQVGDNYSDMNITMEEFFAV